MSKAYEFLKECGISVLRTVRCHWHKWKGNVDYE